MSYTCTVHVANIALEVVLERDDSLSSVQFEGSNFSVDHLFIAHPVKAGKFIGVEDYLIEQAVEKLVEEGGWSALDEADYGDKQAAEAREDA